MDDLFTIVDVGLVTRCSTQTFMVIDSVCTVAGDFSSKSVELLLTALHVEYHINLEILT